MMMMMMCGCHDILKAVIVRCLLVIHALVAIWRVSESYGNNFYWLLAFILVLLFSESCYTIVRRRGKEYQRFMPAFFFYLCTVLTCIWLLELDKTDKFILGQARILDTQINSSQTVPIPAPSLTPNTWIMLVEEMLPYFLFLSRWILPRGRVRRKQLAELLFAFIGIGGDIMEYFSLLGEKAVRSNRNLCYVVLAIWSLSVLQFTVTITVIHQPKRQRNVNVVVADEKGAGRIGDVKRRQKFRNEVSAILLTLAMQDLPFLLVRLYVMLSCNIVDYSLIFFTSKNTMIISLLIYKMAIICGNYYRPRDAADENDVDDDDDDDDEDVHDDDYVQGDGNIRKKKKKKMRLPSLLDGQPDLGQNFEISVAPEIWESFQPSYSLVRESGTWCKAFSESEINHVTVRSTRDGPCVSQIGLAVSSSCQAKRVHSGHQHNKRCDTQLLKLTISLTNASPSHFSGAVNLV